MFRLLGRAFSEPVMSLVRMECSSNNSCGIHAAEAMNSYLGGDIGLANASESKITERCSSSSEGQGKDSKRVDMNKLDKRRGESRLYEIASHRRG